MIDDWRIFLEVPADLPPLVATAILAWTFFVGSCIGSFLNVVIARVPKGMSVVRPRSRCPKCEKPISGFDNIPVASWFILRGKCRTCKTSISFRYPFIEMLMGLAAMAAVARFGIGIYALELFTFTAILTAIAFVDVDTWTVPHPLWISLAVSGIAFAAAHSFILEEGTDLLLERVIGAVGAGVFLGALVVVATGVLRRTGRLTGDQTAMGWGDPLILVGIGAFLGWRLLPLAVFLGSLQGSIVAIALRARGGLPQGDKPVSDDDDWIPPKNAVPFGPFLALAAMQAAFFGDALLARLLPLLGFAAD